MPNHHLGLAGRLFLFLQLVYVFIHLQIQLERAQRIERSSASSSSPRLDDSIDALLLIQLHRPRHWWKIPHSLIKANFQLQCHKKKGQDVIVESVRNGGNVMMAECFKAILGINLRQ